MPLNYDFVNKKKPSPKKEEQPAKAEAKAPDEVVEGADQVPGALTDPIVAAQTLWIEEAMTKMQAFDLNQVVIYFKKVDLIITDMAKQSMNHVISNKATFDQAIQMGTQARKMQSELKKKIDEIKAPYKKFNTDLGALLRKADTKLENIAKDLKSRVLKESSVYMPKPKPAAAPLPKTSETAPPAPVGAGNERVKIDGASVKRNTIPKWELEDLSKVPREYLTVNAVKINQAVKGGAREIPGLKIWEEDDLDMRYNQS